MGLETGTYVQDLVASNPTSTDGVTQGDDHFRLIKSALRSTFPDATRPLYHNKGMALSADRVIAATEDQTFYAVDTASAQIDITLPALTADDQGWSVAFQKTNSGGNSLVISPVSGTINGQASLTISLQYVKVTLVWDGTTFHASFEYNSEEAMRAYLGLFTSATDNRLVKTDGTAGDMQESGITVDDSNNVTGLGNMTQSATGGNVIPVGTTAQRPTPATGMIRWNSTLSRFEGYTGSAWTGLTGWDFTSSEYALTHETVHVIPHGLGALPTKTKLVLRCKTTDDGWAVGDEIDISSYCYVSPGDGAVVVNFGMNATNLYVGLVQSVLSIQLMPRGGGSYVTITPANWRFVARASL